MRNHSMRHWVGILAATLAGNLGLLAVESPSTIIAWGIQNNATIDLPPDLTNVVTLASGYYHNLALRNDGTATGWGETDQQPIGESEALGGLHDLAAVSVGYQHCLVLRSNGTVVAWGQGTSGENSVPAGLTNISAISAGGHHNLALRSDGVVIAWGANNFGQIDVPVGLSNVVAISAGSAYNAGHNLALENDGTVVAWGDNFFGQSVVPPGLSNVVAISAGWYHNLALKNDGTVVAWGNNDYRQTDVPAGLSNVVAIAAGPWQSLALKIDGVVSGWGGDGKSYHEGSVPAGLSNVVAISVAENYSLAVTRQSLPLILVQPVSQTMWESPEDGVGFSVTASGPPPLTYQWQKDGMSIPNATDRTWWLQGVRATNAGLYAAVVSDSFGSVTSAPAQLTVLPFLGIMTNPQNQTVYVGESAVFSVYAKGTETISYQWLKDNTNLPDANGPTLVLTNVQPGDYTTNIVALVSNVVGVKMSTRAKLFVLTNVFPAITMQPQSEVVFPGGKVEFAVTATGRRPLSYQWQKNGSAISGETNSNLVIASAQNSDAANYQVNISNVVGSVASDIVTLRVLSNSFPAAQAGTVVSLGGPLVPPGLTNIVEVAAGRSHGVALRQDGTVAAWGANVFGQSNVPAGLSNVVAVAGAADYSMALRSDGSILVWGFGAAAAYPFPGPFGIIAISADQQHALALRVDGSVAALGLGPPVPSGLSNVVGISAGPYTSLFVQDNGIVVGSFDVPPRVFDPPTDVRAASVGYNYTLYLKNDGSVVGSSVPAGLSNIVAIAAGGPHNLALQDNGTLTIWGGNNPLDTLTNVAAIASGARFALAITTNPPLPILSLQSDGANVILSAPVSVSGYVLEAADSATGGFTNAVTPEDLGDGNLRLPTSSSVKMFRMRKQ